MSIFCKLARSTANLMRFIPNSVPEGSDSVSQHIVTYPEETVAEYVALFEKVADKWSRGVFIVLVVSLTLVLCAAAYLIFRDAGSWP